MRKLMFAVMMLTISACSGGSDSINTAASADTSSAKTTPIPICACDSPSMNLCEVIYVPPTTSPADLANLGLALTNLADLGMSCRMNPGAFQIDINCEQLNDACPTDSLYAMCNIPILNNLMLKSVHFYKSATQTPNDVDIQKECSAAGGTFVKS